MDSNLPPENNPPPPFNQPPPAPPVFTAPPPVISPSSFARPVVGSSRRGTVWMILSLILLGLLGLSLLMNLRNAVSRTTRISRVRGYRSSGPRLEEVTIRESSSSDKIAIVPVEGIISGEAVDQAGFSMVSIVKEELRRARHDSDVKAVILKVNSPGGEVLASDEIANAIEEFQTNSSKPVIVSMGSLAASGGYYVSARSQWIVANELTITGSIGVIMHGFNYRGLLDKVGVRPEVFKSGKYKDMLSGTKEPEEITPEEREMVQKLINETFDKFKSVVADGRTSAYQSNHQRGKRLSSDWQDYADGRILSGRQALNLGFVDELGDFDVAVNRAEKLAGISKAELVEYQPAFELANLFRLFGKTDAKTVKLDLGADIPKIQPGCMYFLSPTYLH